MSNYKSFIFIDESGDDGVGKFREPRNPTGGGASQFLILSCVIVPSDKEKNIPSWRNNIINLLNKKKHRQNLHFYKLNHEQKMVAVRNITTLPIKIISVISNKKTIDIQQGFNKKNKLYWYLCSHLLALASHYCYHNNLYPMKIIFSSRGGMNYREFVTYLDKFKEKGNNIVGNKNIYWDCINVEDIQALNHGSNAGLQLADVIASATARAVEKDIYGYCEDKYFKTILPLFIKDKNIIFDYGCKTLPAVNKMQGYLSEQQREFFNWLKDQK